MKISKCIGRIEDWVLAFLQRRCTHPGEMVAADVLEGCVDQLQVRYCRRCGAIKNSPLCVWRTPDPQLWE